MKNRYALYWINSDSFYRFFCLSIGCLELGAWSLERGGLLGIGEKKEKGVLRICRVGLGVEEGWKCATCGVVRALVERMGGKGC